MAGRGERYATCDTKAYRRLGSRQGLNEVCTARLTLPPLVPRSTLQADLAVHPVRRHAYRRVGLEGRVPQLQAVAEEEGRRPRAHRHVAVEPAQAGGAGGQHVSWAVRGYPMAASVVYG